MAGTLLVMFWMEVQLNMMLLPSITCVPHAAVRRNMHQAFVASHIKLIIVEMTDAEGNACSVVPIHVQGRLHDLTQRDQRDGRMLCDSRYWECGICMKRIYEDRQKILTVKIVLLGPCHMAVKEGTMFSLKKTISTGM